MCAMLMILLIQILVTVSCSSPFAWRNDSANLLFTRQLNAYLATKPFSDDVSGSSISDHPPVRLDWSLGPDLPNFAQKDGVGCWIGTDFVVAGGLWEEVDRLKTQDLPESRPPPPNRVMKLATDTGIWSVLPDAPFAPTRGTGTCTSDALFLVGGRNTHTPHRGCDVARLRKSASGNNWEWDQLPPLPAKGWRWLGSAGVVGDWLVVTTGTNTSRFQWYDDHGMEEASGHIPQTSLPHRIPSFRLNLSRPGSGWEQIADFPGGGLDAPNDAVVNGSLYVLGGWRSSVEGMQAWKELFDLQLPVPITEGTNGGQLVRKCWKYTPATDSWAAIPDAPYHIERGGTVVLKDRYILSIGSTHGKNSFRVGTNCAHDSHCKFAKPFHSIPDMALGGGILTYYGDDVLSYDTFENKWSRVGVLPYGCITSHCGTNGTHIICALGEPRHGHNGNAESVVQIAKIQWIEPPSILV